MSKLSSSERLNENIAKGFELLQGLKEVKGLLMENSSEMRVEVNMEESPNLVNSLGEMFPEMDKAHPDYGFITLEMFIKANRIIAAAGEARADSELSKMERK